MILTAAEMIVWVILLRWGAPLMLAALIWGGIGLGEIITNGIRTGKP